MVGLLGVNAVATHAFAFLIGAATGAAGQYFADKYTDQRRRQEGAAATKDEFARLFNLMPDLLREMQTDLSESSHATWREFFVIPKGTHVWPTPNTFFYEDDLANDYLGKAKILANRGYVIDVTPGDAPKFRMNEEFVTLLKAAPRQGS